MNNNRTCGEHQECVACADDGQDVEEGCLFGYEYVGTYNVNNASDQRGNQAIADDRKYLFHLTLTAEKCTYTPVGDGPQNNKSCGLGKNEQSVVAGRVKISE